MDDSFKKPLNSWLNEFYEGTATISEISRNASLAGVGIVWIFKKTDIGLGSTQSLLPKELKAALILIILSMVFDVLQYIWRAVSSYCVYRHYMNKFDDQLITKEQTEDITAPVIVEGGTWVFFILKLIFVSWGYIKILFFLTDKL